MIYVIVTDDLSDPPGRVRWPQLVSLPVSPVTSGDGHGSVTGHLVCKPLTGADHPSDGRG